MAEALDTLRAEDGVSLFYLLLIFVVTLSLFQRLWAAASADELRSPHILVIILGLFLMLQCWRWSRPEPSPLRASSAAPPPEPEPIAQAEVVPYPNR